MKQPSRAHCILQQMQQPVRTFPGDWQLLSQHTGTVNRSQMAQSIHRALMHESRTDGMASKNMEHCHLQPSSTSISLRLLDAKDIFDRIRRSSQDRQEVFFHLSVHVPCYDPQSAARRETYPPSLLQETIEVRILHCAFSACAVVSSSGSAF